MIAALVRASLTSRGPSWLVMAMAWSSRCASAFDPLPRVSSAAESFVPARRPPEVSPGVLSDRKHRRSIKFATSDSSLRSFSRFALSPTPSHPHQRLKSFGPLLSARNLLDAPERPAVSGESDASGGWWCKLALTPRFCASATMSNVFFVRSKSPMPQSGQPC